MSQLTLYNVTSRVTDRFHSSPNMTAESTQRVAAHGLPLDGSCEVVHRGLWSRPEWPRAAPAFRKM